MSRVIGVQSTGNRLRVDVHVGSRHHSSAVDSYSSVLRPSLQRVLHLRSRCSHRVPDVVGVHVIVDMVNVDSRCRLEHLRLCLIQRIVRKDEQSAVCLDIRVIDNGLVLFVQSRIRLCVAAAGHVAPCAHLNDFIEVASVTADRDDVALDLRRSPVCGTDGYYALQICSKVSVRVNAAEGSADYDLVIVLRTEIRDRCYPDVSERRLDINAVLDGNVVVTVDLVLGVDAAGRQN